MNQTRAFEIESYGNGFACQIVRTADGASVFLQGDEQPEPKTVIRFLVFML